VPHGPRRSSGRGRRPRGRHRRQGRRIRRGFRYSRRGRQSRSLSPIASSSVQMNGVRDVATVRTSSVSLAARRSRSTVRGPSPSVTSNRRPVPADRVLRLDAGRARVGRRGLRLNHSRPAPRRTTAWVRAVPRTRTAMIRLWMRVLVAAPRGTPGGGRDPAVRRSERRAPKPPPAAGRGSNCVGSPVVYDGRGCHSAVPSRSIVDAAITFAAVNISSIGTNSSATWA